MPVDDEMHAGSQGFGCGGVGCIVVTGWWVGQSRQSQEYRQHQGGKPKSETFAKRSGKVIHGNPPRVGLERSGVLNLINGIITCLRVEMK